MEDLQSYLVNLSDRLDNEGKKICADAVDKIIKKASLQKIAQYVGVIGYVLKQNRAMSNCIRKKRVSSKESMQNVVLECLKEYQDGQNYHDSEWLSKYAQVIKREPEKFDISHLVLLASIDEYSDIDKDISLLNRTSKILEENNVNDEVINMISSHLSAFNEILMKDSGKKTNFKLAAPQRGWWSRFWNPSKFSLGNPRSWFKNVRERGKDLDAINEMNSIIVNLSSLSRITQQIITAISRLKSENVGYVSESNKDLPDSEKENFIKNFGEKVSSLPFDDWNKMMLTLQQMRYLLREFNPSNSYNKEIHNRSISSIDQIYNSMEEVYKILNAIQLDMESLRSEMPILGRELGLTDQGENNPFGISSPAEEYSDLQVALEKLYKNPMDTRSQLYCQKAHARLWDKLRYIQRPIDDDMNRWLSEKEPNPDNAELDPEKSEKPQVEITENEQKNEQKNKNQISESIESQSTMLSDSDATAIRNYLKEAIERKENPKDILKDLIAFLNQSINIDLSKILEDLDGSNSIKELEIDNSDDNDDDDDDTGGLRYRRIKRASLYNTIVKLADILDKTHPKIADVFDSFMAENLSDFKKSGFRNAITVDKF